MRLKSTEFIKWNKYIDSLLMTLLGAIERLKTI